MTDYYHRCGRPHGPDEPCGRTIAEQLDNASDGRQFAQVIQNLFAALEVDR